MRSQIVGLWALSCLPIKRRLAKVEQTRDFKTGGSGKLEGWSEEGEAGNVSNIVSRFNVIKIHSCRQNRNDHLIKKKRLGEKKT